MAARRPGRRPSALVAGERLAGQLEQDPAVAGGAPVRPRPGSVTVPRPASASLPCTVAPATTRGASRATAAGVASARRRTGPPPSSGLADLEPGEPRHGDARVGQDLLDRLLRSRTDGCSSRTTLLEEGVDPALDDLRRCACSGLPSSRVICLGDRAARSRRRRPAPRRGSGTAGAWPPPAWPTPRAASASTPSSAGRARRPRRQLPGRLCRYVATCRSSTAYPAQLELLADDRGAGPSMALRRGLPGRSSRPSTASRSAGRAAAAALAICAASSWNWSFLATKSVSQFSSTRSRPGPSSTAVTRPLPAVRLGPLAHVLGALDAQDLDGRVEVAVGLRRVPSCSPSSRRRCARGAA